MSGKRGVSVVVGYVLLITFGIILSVLVYNYLRTYVPTSTVSCPDGVSLLLKDYSYDCSSGQLNLTLENNGKFEVSGYNIHGTTNSTETLATYDLSPFYDKNTSGDGVVIHNAVYFYAAFTNSLGLGKEVHESFNLSSAKKEIYSLNLVPVRLTMQGNTEQFAVCTSAAVTQTLSCNAG